MNLRESVALTLVGLVVVLTVRYYEKKYKRNLYPAFWSLGTGMVYGLIDNLVSSLNVIDQKRLYAILLHEPF